jgi:hypothetical protein
MRKHLAALCAAGAIAVAVSAHAAPTYLQDFEAAGLTAPWNLEPGYSGTSTNVDVTSTITQVTDDGAAGTAQSADLSIPYTTAAPTTLTNGQAWQVRLLPNTAGHGATSFAPTGFVGYYLKVDPAVAANMTTAPVLEEASGGTGTATAGILKPIIKDGQWHLYAWNMGDASQFPNSWGQVATDPYGVSGLGDTTLVGNQVFDSIALLSSTPDNAVVRIDQIGFNLDVPEPASLGLLSLGGLALLRRRRRQLV